jgi:DNA-binding beta-propeller fold protein YncE
MRLLFSLWLAVCGVAFGQLTPVPPPSTAMPSHPFFILKTWIIGGVGSWDYMTMDPAANQLFIAHGPTVQVVDVASGTVAGTIKGLREAHAIILGEDGTYGYISDGPADMVRVFDRRTFEVVASIPTGPAPRSMALDPTSGLLFVVGSHPNVAGGPGTIQARSGATERAGGTRGRSGGPESSLTVIDVEKRIPLAQIVLPGNLGFAQADGDGRIYITVADRNLILRVNAQSIGNYVHQIIETRPKEKQPRTGRQPDKGLLLDWTPGTQPAPPVDAYPAAFFLGSNCDHPRSLAFDPAHDRLFAACSNYKMVVLNGATGQGVAAVPIGPGADAIGYDPNRGLIYTANGAGDGSLTIIRQDVTDTYSVIQTLPTRQHARTLAVDPANGDVYLTTVIYGAELSTPFTNGAPASLKVAPVDASFQVLVVGN